MSQTTRFSVSFEEKTDTGQSSSRNRRSRHQGNEPDYPCESSIVPLRQTNNGQSSSRNINSGVQRSNSTETRVPHSLSNRPAQQLTPIPGSDASSPPSYSESVTLEHTITNEDESFAVSKHKLPTNSSSPDSTSRIRAKTSSYVSHIPQQPQSLTAALEKISISKSDNGHGKPLIQSPSTASSKTGAASSKHEQGDTIDVDIITSNQGMSTANTLRSQYPFPAMHTLGRQTPSGLKVGGKGISNPIPNHGETTL